MKILLRIFVAILMLTVGRNAASRLPLSKSFEFSYPATSTFIPADQAAIAIKMWINPQVVQLNATTLAVVDFEAQTRVTIISSLAQTRSFNLSISQGDSDVGLLPAVIHSPTDNAIIIFYAFLQISDSVMSSLRATKFDQNGNVQFDGFIGLPTQNVSYITATRINQTHLALLASNIDINTSTLYIMKYDLTIASGTPVHVTTTPLSFTLASDGTYLYYGSCFYNVSDNCSIIKYHPSDINTILGVFEVPAYTDMSITYTNNSLIVLLQVTPSTKGLVVLGTSNMLPLQPLSQTTLAGYNTRPYPVFAKGYYALIYRWSTPWFEQPFTVDDIGLASWDTGFNIGVDPGTTFTQFIVGTTKHLAQQNGYVLSLKEVDLTNNMTKFFGDFCGDMNVTGTEQCDGSVSCVDCQCITGTAPMGGLCTDFCGNGIVTGAEQCDGGANCDSTCQCTTGTVPTVPRSTSCMATLSPVPQFTSCSQCQGDTPICLEARSVCVGRRIVPILQCIETDKSGTKVASFSYQNQVTSQVNIASGPNNNLTPSGQPVEGFLSGRPFYYPLSAFTSNYSTAVAVNWFVDGYLLTFDTSDSSLACPMNVSFLVVVSPPPTDLTAFVTNLRNVLAASLNVDVNRIDVHDSTQKKRQSDVEQELEAVVTAGNSSEPSASEVVTNFVNNQTAINQVKEEVPAVQDIVGKPLDNEITGQQVTTSSPQVTPVAVSVSTASTLPLVNSVVLLLVFVFG